MQRDLPTGTVTFLFTDVEGSTKLLHELGAEGYAAALAEHRRILREAFDTHGGVEVDTQGDAFFVAFPTAPGALQAAAESLQGLDAGPIRVRMGIHTGTPHLAEEGYVGVDVHRAARIAACGHGGQVLISAATVALMGTDGLLDLGEHQLKDFDEPVSLYQLGEESFPPLKTISNTNLPRPTSSFVGRDREVEEVASLLQEGARLLTLTGPGGSGKTRLAIEAAATLVSEFKAGVFWVGLAPLRDPALVAETIGQTLGAKDGLADHIAERELLLLLDNLEQVVGAAPNLATLVESCPNLRLLVTSRELMRVRGEVEYPVLPLAEPDAVELFCARARTEPDETVHELCRALDNLPLALELAAARASVLSPKQILERLSKRLDLLKGGRDADPRQQTLRATIEWSYDLLPEPERRLFARLSVFAGGCTLAAAEDVADADLDTLQPLVEKSLLRHTEERFWMLETIREYAAERLEQTSHATELRRRHAHHYLALAEEAEPWLREYDSDWLDRLEREHDNFRTAFGELDAAAETQLLLRLVGASFWYWAPRGHLGEGRRYIQRVLGDERPTAARAKALVAAADLAADAGDAATVRRRATEALELYRVVGDAWGSAYCVFLRAMSCAIEAEWEQGRELLAEAVRLFDELGDEYYTLETRRRLAWMYQNLGDVDRARAMHDENLRRARLAGNEQLVGTTSGVLAGFAMNAGRLEDALELLRDAIGIHRKLGDILGLLFDLHRSARLLFFLGRGPEAATRLLSKAAALHMEMDLPPEPWLAANDQQTVDGIHAKLDDAAFAEAWAQGERLTLDEAIELALDSLD